MSEFSADKARALCADLEQTDRDLPNAPWEVATSNSFRRVNGPDGCDGGVLHAVTQRDGHPDLSMSEESLRRLSWLRNNLPAIAAQLRAAVARVQELETAQAGAMGEFAGLRVTAGFFETRCAVLEKLLRSERLDDDDQDALTGCCPLSHPPHVVCRGCGLTMDDYRDAALRAIRGDK